MGALRQVLPGGVTRANPCAPITGAEFWNKPVYFNLYISLFPYTPCARTARCITYVQLLSRGPVRVVKLNAVYTTLWEAAMTGGKSG